ncbi:TIGR02186 family protein [Geminicoccaceae bacterium 1502E]|nr:TIGR02186 family protein [Geminicoccaceae bacterium 1502E]
MQSPWRRLLGTALLLAALAVPARPQAASGFVADLSHHLIAITTAFSGTEVLLFGALENPSSDVVVIVRGPLREQTVRRRSRLAFMWIGKADLRFRNVPDFYAVAASRPLDEIASEGELARQQIGARNLVLEPIGAAGLAREEIDEFRAALIRNKRRAGLYYDRVAKISFLGGKLFRTTLEFPGNVPPGNYQVQVLELRDGIVQSAQTSGLVISKIGLEAEIYDLAHKDAPIYAMASILLAVAAGWTASAAFRKR